MSDPRNTSKYRKCKFVGKKYLYDLLNHFNSNLAIIPFFQNFVMPNFLLYFILTENG